MFASFKIGTVFGITIRVAWIFLVMALCAGFLVEDTPYWITAIYIVTLFGIVLLHELGHSLVALYYGIHVVDITFWPLGGMARMSEIPESPKIETLIAIAGPAVNFALAALAMPVALSAGLEALPETWLQGGLVLRLAVTFIGMNLVLGVFNLLPAFPMDGGRVLRALLGIWSDWVTATRRAVKVGRVFAVLMIIAGFTRWGSFGMTLIGLFIWYAGTRELWAVRMRHGDIPTPTGAGPRPAYFETRQPVVATQAEPDPSGARRPTSWPSAQESQRRGITDDDIARLEAFQGRLRNAAPPTE